MPQVIIAEPQKITARQIDGWSIFGIIVFIITIVFVIQTVLIPIPLFISRSLIKLSKFFRITDPPPTSNVHTENLAGPPGSQPANSSPDVVYEQKRWYFPLNFVTAPVVGVLVLLTTGCIDLGVVSRGIFGIDGVVPIDVLIFFMCLAYIAMSLDSTGALRFLAFWVARKGGSSGSGPRLYLYFYILFFVCGVAVGNDPVILSGTAFLAYFTAAAGIEPPTAWIFAEFVSANIASAVLVSSNPTNLLIAGAFRLNFLTGYTKYTILPALVPAIVGYPLLYAMFRSSSAAMIPGSILPPDVRPLSALTDPSGAVFHATLMMVTLIVLVGTNFVEGGGIRVWMVTLPAAIVAMARDALYDVLSGPRPNVDAIGGGPPPQADDKEPEGKIGTQGAQQEEIMMDVLERGEVSRERISGDPTRSMYTILEAETPEEPRASSAASSTKSLAKEAKGGDGIGDNNAEGLQLGQGNTPRDGEGTGRAQKGSNPITTSEIPTTLETTPPPSSIRRDRGASQSTSAEVSSSVLQQRVRTAASQNQASDNPSYPPAPAFKDTPKTPAPRRPRISLAYFYRSISDRIPTLTSTFLRLPWPLIPFALGMFILVIALGALGWISIFASWMATVCVNPAATVFFVGFMSALVMCPLCGTNIGAAILLVEIIRDPNFIDSPTVKADPRILKSAIFAVALGSNLGAFSFTFSASLAGLLWVNILRQKGIIVRGRDFVKWNFMPIIFLTFISLCVVLFEIEFF